jgi:hypothetical protein
MSESRQARTRDDCLREVLALLDEAMTHGRHGLLVRAREEVVQVLYDLDRARALPEPRQLRRALALLHDAACYPNKDINELQIVGARDMIAAVVGKTRRKRA